LEIKKQPLGTIIKNTFKIRLYTFLKIPLLSYVSPVVEELSEERCIVRIPLKRRNKNHLNSMYFGVLACGADCTTGLLAMKMIESGTQKLSLVFKDFQANFLKRPEKDVYFICEDYETISQIISQAVQTGERVSIPVRSYAVTELGGEAVAEFKLTLSLKKK